MKKIDRVIKTRNKNYQLDKITKNFWHQNDDNHYF